MTLSEIIIQAMTQLGNSTDSQMQDKYKEKYASLANEAYIDLAEYLQLRRTDSLAVGADGEISVEALPFECTKILSVWQNKRPVSYARGSATSKIAVDAVGEVQIEYRYIPPPLTSDTDSPALPESMHHLLVTYICGRDQTTQDETTQRRAVQFFDLYERGKQRALKTYGEPEDFRIINKY